MKQRTTNTIIAAAIYRADKAGVEHCMTIEELAPIIAEQEDLPKKEINCEEIVEDIHHLYLLEQYE